MSSRVNFVGISRKFWKAKGLQMVNLRSLLGNQRKRKMSNVDSICTGFSKKVPAKFSDTCSARADGLCIGIPALVGGRKAGNSNLQEFCCTTL